MVTIPVSLENLSFERLDLHRHFVVIDCDFTVYLILNPIGEKPRAGTDIAVINIGSWQLDAWSFLVKDQFPNEAGFSAVLAWDKTLEQETEQGRKAPRITESDVDIANSVSSLKGQPVNITGFSLDDGKSLKVSTLENEYVNVRTFEHYLNVCKFAMDCGVGKSIDLSKVPESLIIDQGSDFVKILFPTGFSYKKGDEVGSCYGNNIIVSNSIGYALTGGVLRSDSFVRLAFSDGVITHNSGVFTYFSSRDTTGTVGAVYSVDFEDAKLYIYD